MSQMNQNIFYILLILSLWSCESKESTIKDVPSTTQVESPKPDVSSLPVDTNKGRLAWQKPSEVINKIGDLTGKTVADIGAGTGYFTFRFIRQAEKVIAIDIDQEMIDLIEMFKENLDPEQQKKIETRLATPEDAKLWPEEADVIVIINTIGYIEDPTKYLTKLRRGLAPGGMIMIVDFKMKRIIEEIAPPTQYRVSILELENMLSKAGYSDIETDDTSLDYQYMIVAQKG